MAQALSAYYACPVLGENKLRLVKWCQSANRLPHPPPPPQIKCLFHTPALNSLVWFTMHTSCGSVPNGVKGVLHFLFLITDLFELWLEMDIIIAWWHCRLWPRMAHLSCEFRKKNNFWWRTQDPATDVVPSSLALTRCQTSQSTCTAIYAYAIFKLQLF